MSMKSSNDTIGNWTLNLPTCGAVPQPTAPPRVPRYLCTPVKYRSTKLPFSFIHHCRRYMITENDSVIKLHALKQRNAAIVSFPDGVIHRSAVFPIFSRCWQSIQRLRKDVVCLEWMRAPRDSPVTFSPHWSVLFSSKPLLLVGSTERAVRLRELWRQAIHVTPVSCLIST